MLKRLYDWTMNLAAHHNAVWVLGIVSFLESSFFPIPPHPLLMALIFANRDKAFFYTAVCITTSVLGGIGGYVIGAVLFDYIGQPILQFYGYADQFDAFKIKYNEWGAIAVFTAAVTPIPYKIFTITSGATHLDFFSFTLASIAGRGLVFSVIGFLVYWFGAPIREFIEKRLGLIMTLFCILIVGGFVLVKALS